MVEIQVYVDMLKYFSRTIHQKRGKKSSLLYNILKNEIKNEKDYLGSIIGRRHVNK